MSDWVQRSLSEYTAVVCGIEDCVAAGVKELEVHVTGGGGTMRMAVNLIYSFAAMKLEHMLVMTPDREPCEIRASCIIGRLRIRRTERQPIDSSPTALGLGDGPVRHRPDQTGPLLRSRPVTRPERPAEGFWQSNLGRSRGRVCRHGGGQDHRGRRPQIDIHWFGRDCSGAPSGCRGSWHHLDHGGPPDPLVRRGRRLGEPTLRHHGQKPA